LQSEEDKAVRQMRDKKATGDNEVPGNEQKLLGEDGLRIMTKLISNMFETGEQLKDFFEITMISLKNPKATKCSNHHTLSLITPTTKRVARIRRRRIYKNAEDVVGED
jgi:hypothetical protein